MVIFWMSFRKTCILVILYSYVNLLIVLLTKNENNKQIRLNTWLLNMFDWRIYLLVL